MRAVSGASWPRSESSLRVSLVEHDMSSPLESALRWAPENQERHVSSDEHYRLESACSCHNICTPSAVLNRAGRERGAVPRASVDCAVLGGGALAPGEVVLPAGRGAGQGLPFRSRTPSPPPSACCPHAIAANLPGTVQNMHSRTLGDSPCLALHMAHFCTLCSGSRP